MEVTASDNVMKKKTATKWAKPLVKTKKLH